MNPQSLDLPRDLPRELAILAGGLVVSVGLVALATRDWGAITAFLGGVAALGLGLWALLRRRPPPAPPGFAPPDWSVTVAAIDLPQLGPDCGIAVTDRAGRLVCANPRFERWFGLDAAPPNVPLASDGQQALAQLARVAWRDGGGELASVSGSATAGNVPPRWHCRAARAGRADDHLVWQFTLIAAKDGIADARALVAGPLGTALARGGMAAALVDAEGVIRGASVEFVRAATGNPEADLAGQPFVAALTQDEDDRIYWAADNRRAAPLTLHYLPFGEEHSTSDSPAALALVLLVEAGAGLGTAADLVTAAPHLEALLAQLPLGLAMADRNAQLLFANPAFMRAAGREGEPPPTYPTDLVVREDKAAISDAIRRCARTPGATSDVAVRLAALPDEPITLSIAGVRGLGDAAVLLSLNDTTEETRLKRQVAQATKMQAVGQLAGGVAHDFNNVLTAILGTCELMLLRHTPGDSDYDDIQQVRASSNRAASLTRQLLAFSRQQTLRPEVLQLPDVVTEISQMLRRLIGEKIALVVTHGRDLAPVRADPTQLEQVIVNLAVNARDAIHDHARRHTGEGAGRLLLATRRVSASQVRAMRSEILPIGDYTALIVEDTGGGIAGANFGKIWEPFFTTKDAAKDGARGSGGGNLGGTGLGLSTVYGIVKQSGGFIFAENYWADGVPESGRPTGARFSMYLPAHQGAVQPAEAKRSEGTAEWAGGGHILLVEDEDAVRAVAERALARAGYTVTAASDGDDGLALVEARLVGPQPMFDLIVSDVVMPVMDGPAMVRAVHAKAAVPVIFMSGYAEEQLRREIDIAGMHFLPKPFSVAQITGKVAEVLVTRAAGGPP